MGAAGRRRGRVPQHPGRPASRARARGWSCSKHGDRRRPRRPAHARTCCATRARPTCSTTVPTSEPCRSCSATRRSAPRRCTRWCPPSVCGRCTSRAHPRASNGRHASVTCCRWPVPDACRPRPPCARRPRGASARQLRQQLDDAPGGGSTGRSRFDENFADSGQVAAEQGENRLAGGLAQRAARRGRAGAGQARRRHLRPVRDVRRADRRGPPRGHAGHPVSASTTPDERRRDVARWLATVHLRQTVLRLAAARRPAAADEAWAEAQLLPARSSCGAACRAPTAATRSAWPGGSSGRLGARGHPPGAGRRAAARRGQDRVRPRHLRPGRRHPVRAEVAGRDAASAWTRGRGFTRRVGLYLLHPELGGDLLGDGRQRSAHRGVGPASTTDRRARGRSIPTSRRRSRPPTTTESWLRGRPDGSDPRRGARARWRCRPLRASPTRPACAFSAPVLEDLATVRRVGRQLAVALLDRRKQLDHGVRGVGLQRPVLRVAWPRAPRVSRRCTPRGSTAGSTRPASCAGS